jgi:hypothetical protein
MYVVTAMEEQTPLGLTDDELATVMRAIAPIHRFDRPKILECVARRLRQEPMVGPGTLNKIIRELMATRQYRLADGNARSPWHRGN